MSENDFSGYCYSLQQVQGLQGLPGGARGAMVAQNDEISGSGVRLQSNTPSQHVVFKASNHEKIREAKFPPQLYYCICFYKNHIYNSICNIRTLFLTPFLGGFWRASKRKTASGKPGKPKRRGVAVLLVLLRPNLPSILLHFLQLSSAAVIKS
jgi:hypothetical protein